MAEEKDERGFFGEQPFFRSKPAIEAVASSASRPIEPAQPANKPHYLGHRERARDKFAEHGAAHMADYELLELLLFRALPRGDTKPIAKALLARFGTLAEVLGAPRNQLAEVKGVGPSIALDLKLIAEVGARAARDQIKGKTVLSSWKEVLAYCRAAMAFEEREHFRILFLDKKNALIRDEVQQTGTVDHTPVYVREVIRRALDLSASALILVHNHPSGDPTPSRADIEMTKAIADTGTKMGITVHDHIITAKQGVASLKGLGLF